MVMIENDMENALNTKIIGSGNETMVLAHGYGGDQSLWDQIISSLSEKHKVVVFDWPFSGQVKDEKLFDPVKYSSYDAFADDLIALLEHLNLVSTIFMGHSMSAMIGCIASIKRPHLFKSLILLGGSPRYINEEGYEGGFDKSTIENIFSAMESDYENWSTNFASFALGQTENHSVSVEKFRKCLKRMKPHVALPLAKTVFGSDEREILAKVTTPATIIQSTNDGVVPNSVAYYMQEKIKVKPKLEFINDDGHFPQLTAPLELLKILGKVLGF